MITNKILVIDDNVNLYRVIEAFFSPSYTKTIFSKSIDVIYEVINNKNEIINLIVVNNSCIENAKVNFYEIIKNSNHSNIKNIPILVTNANDLKLTDDKQFTYLKKSTPEIDILSQINTLILKNNCHVEHSLAINKTNVLFENSPLPLMLLDEKLDVKKTNKAFEKQVYTLHNDVLVNLLDLFHTDVNQIKADLKTAIIEKIEGLDLKVQIGSKPFSASFIFIYNDQQEFINTILVLQELELDSVQKFEKFNMQSFVNSSLIAIFKINTAGVILNWSLGAKNIFKFTKKDIVGKSFSTIVPNENTEQSKQIIQKIFSTQKEQHFSRVARRKDGTYVNVLLTFLPVKNEDGKVDGLYVIGKDTTHIKQLTDELNNYKYAIDKSIIVATIDRKGIIINVNDNFLNIYGCQEHDVVGKPFSVLKSDNINKPIYKSLFDTIESGKIWKGELFQKAKSGVEFCLDVTIVPFVDDQGVTVKHMLFCNDITQRKLLEDKEKENILMDKSLKMKDEFMANMSHEIRTPLNVILGYADLLLESEMENEQYKQISTIKKSSKLLLSIINDILDLSKLESGKIVLDDTAFDLKHLVLSVKDMLEIEANKKDLFFKVKIDNTIPKYVSSDATRIEQILVNIVNNAIKFTKIGYVKITVELESKDEHVARVVFKISDSGIGIPKDKIDTIFESFTQSSRYITREFGGTGLGLTIVKKLMDQLKGDISVTSTVGKGTEFKLVIPFEISNQEILAQNTTPLMASKNNTVDEPLNLNILLAEDNEFNQILAKTRLESWNCMVDIANNGLEAIEKLRVNDYHLILMDIQMPLLNGYDATKRIRSEFTCHKQEIPIIALTAHASNGDAKEAKKLGFNDYLFKPFNLKLLHARLKQYGAVTTALASEKADIQDDDIVNLVDFSYIESESLGHPNIIKMLIESFIREFELFISSAKQANIDQDWNGVYKAVHRIGPSISNFNIKNIKPYTIQLYEKSKEEQENDTYLSLITKAEEEFKKIKPIFQKKLNQLQTVI